ncbi:alpha/beta-hydrolase [Rhizodiscina lignyota]|uniref:Alpha/beta-hydrolase n=1 Tax=Rhizodiscina lignyota TaxID=1504668 RepID=A0A9P4I2I1_9PEZI|nr:alpha/beta-hydrolase [Rhizodiscina lignyota]
MVVRSENSWETETKSELVSIGTHRLFLSTSGPPRKPGTAVVIFFTGGGVPVLAHTHLQDLISKSSRCYFYDRAGYDYSERGPIEHPTSEDAAYEAWNLLHAVKVAPPYVLVSHSYGGIIARTFLEQHSEAIAGMVLADTAAELMYELWPHVPATSLEAVGKDVDFLKLTHFLEESGYTEEELEAIIKAIERTQPAAIAEDNRTGVRALAQRRQYTRVIMGDKPLSVIRCNMARDYRIIYEAGVKAGNGTEAEREDAKRFIETFDIYDDVIRAAQVRLSRNSKYVVIEDCGHDVPMRRPRIIANEVEWVLEQLQSRSPQEIAS